MSCGVEQSTVLPSLALLGAAAWAVGYRISQGTLGSQRERERRKRRAGETLGIASQELRIEPKALGRATERSSFTEKVEESSHLAMRAIHEDRVVLLDRDGYLMTRGHLRILGACLICVSLAAIAQPGGDLLFASFRSLLVLLLCIDFALTQPGQVAFQTTNSAPKQLRRLPLHSGQSARDALPDSLLASLRNAVPFERLRLGALQLWALLMLIWFEVFRHPKLRENACHGEAVALLLAERGAALTMTLAWLCATLARLAAWRCEACLWLAPRAEEILSEFVDSDGGLVQHGAACALAEGLCGHDAEGWLMELQQLSVLVMDGSSQLVPSARSEHRATELLEMQRETQQELQRLTQVLEVKEAAPRASRRFEPPERSEDGKEAAPRASRRFEPPERSEDGKVSKAPSMSTTRSSIREELLKTKLDFPRGDMVGEGKPSDSGDSSSPPVRLRRAEDVSSVSERARAARDLAQGGLAQLLEEALTPATEMRSSKVRLPVKAAQRSASQGALETRTASKSTDGGPRRPKRYSEMRKMSLEQRLSGQRTEPTAEPGEAHWTEGVGPPGGGPVPAVSPAPPSPPWNVQSFSPLTGPLMHEASNV